MELGVVLYDLYGTYYGIVLKLKGRFHGGSHETLRHLFLGGVFLASRTLNAKNGYGLKDGPTMEVRHVYGVPQTSPRIEKLSLHSFKWRFCNKRQLNIVFETKIRHSSISRFVWVERVCAAVFETRFTAKSEIHDLVSETLILYLRGKYLSLFDSCFGPIQISFWRLSCGVDTEKEPEVELVLFR